MNINDKVNTTLGVGTLVAINDKTMDVQFELRLDEQGQPLTYTSGRYVVKDEEGNEVVLSEGDGIVYHMTKDGIHIPDNKPAGLYTFTTEEVTPTK